MRSRKGISNLTKFCCACGQSMGLEIAILDKLQGDGKIDYCMECQTKAFHSVLNKWLDDVRDSRLRFELKERMKEVGKLGAN